MDLTRMIIPKSDQKNADDFLDGPRTFTVTDEIEYADEKQPAGLVLDGDTAHPYKPCKSMRRVLNVGWGKESYVGRRLTLYNDPTIPFGGQEVGGIRISHMSHIAKTLKLKLTETKGRRAPFIVEPLPDVAPAAPAPTVEDVAACMSTDQLRAMWHDASDDVRAHITARVAELNTTPEDAA